MPMPMAWCSPRVRGPARHLGRDPDHHPRRGRNPAHPGPRALRAHRREGLGQVRGHEPDRLVQGPRHDHGRVEGRRARREGRHLRLDRQHLGVGGRVRHARRHHRGGAGSRGQDRDGQARPGHRAQRPAASGAGQLRRLPRHRPRARRAATRCTWSTRSTTTASKVRRPPRSRSSRCSATRRTSTSSRSATPATTPRTSAATAKRPSAAPPRSCRACSASRPRAARRSCSATS